MGIRVEVVGGLVEYWVGSGLGVLELKGFLRRLRI